MSYDELYLFQCGDTDRYALSVDRTGCNIPRKSNPWLLRGDISEVDLADLEAPIREVAQRGYCVLVVTAEE